MEMETRFSLDLKLEHDEIISHVRTLRGGRDVFYVSGIENSFFLVYDSATGFHISYTEEAILNHFYQNGSPMRVPNMYKIKALHRQMMDHQYSYEGILEMPFGNKKMKISHIQTNFVKEEGSSGVQSVEYLVVIGNHMGVFMYYKDYGYSIVNRSYQAISIPQISSG